MMEEKGDNALVTLDIKDEITGNVEKVTKTAREWLNTRTEDFMATLTKEEGGKLPMKELLKNPKLAEAIGVALATRASHLVPSILANSYSKIIDSFQETFHRGADGEIERIKKGLGPKYADLATLNKQIEDARRETNTVSEAERPEAEQKLKGLQAQKTQLEGDKDFKRLAKIEKEKKKFDEKVEANSLGLAPTKADEKGGEPQPVAPIPPPAPPKI